MKPRSSSRGRLSRSAEFERVYRQGRSTANRVKRLLREAFADAEADLSPGQDVVVVARPQARELAEREGLAGIAASLTELIARAGLRPGTTALEERL